MRCKKLFIGLVTLTLSWFPSTVFSQDTIRAHIYFKSGSYETKPHNTYLQRFADACAGFDSAHIFIDGFCDDEGSDAFNIQLSEQRAMAVEAFLKQYITIKANFTITGHGESNPVASNEFDDTKFQNRRVDMLVIGYQYGYTSSISDISQIVDAVPEFVELSDVSLRELLLALEKDDRLVLRDVQFPMSSDSILPSSFIVLDTLASILMDYPNLIIQLEGHICCTSETGMAGHKDAYNATNGKYSLSSDRALNVFMYLVYKGVPSRQLKYVGLSGSQKLVWPEATAKDQQKNRRVEVRLLEK